MLMDVAMETPLFYRERKDDLARLVAGRLANPHNILGLHQAAEGGQVIRVWRPGAEKLVIELKNTLVPMLRIDDAGLFELKVPSDINATDYRIYHSSELLDYDPYAFWPSFGQIDSYLFSQGVHYELFNSMGGRLCQHQDCPGAKFALWAPSAVSVALVGDFNHWDGRVNPMRTMGESGVWEIFIPGLQAGQLYKFEVRTQNDEILVKADPYAYASQQRPLTASKLASISDDNWDDAEWLQSRMERKDDAYPMTVYELHLGSWKQKDGSFYNYRELAKELVSYCKDMGFTHIELMPVSEHPLDESWGYQVTGFYAVTSRFGSPEDFQYFVNYCHKNELGVLMDWVPAHFPTDAFSLAKFDGTELYEHEDLRKGFHPHWNTCIFNYGRFEVSNFLIANALFWCQKMHIDGLRVDAVASMLYLDYGREQGDWLPNQHGGKENLEAIEFIKHLNSIVHQRCPGVKMIAEESTSFTGVTHPVDDQGLGFDLKWNMGWMNDTLSYFAVDPFFRHYHHNQLTFGLVYAFSERFANVFSHDEVVHGKQSLISKMPGDIWQKFANLRLLYSYMVCQPGKNLLFMGGEFGQWSEWNCKKELDWSLLNYSSHSAVKRMVQELNHFYINHGCMWERDFDYTGFAWVDFKDRQNSVISYLRKGSLDQMLCVHNFTPTYHSDYFVHLDNLESIQECFNTDAAIYGGSDKGNHHIEILRDAKNHSYGVRLSIAPLSTMIFEVKFKG